MKQLTIRALLVLSILLGLFAGPAASPAGALEVGSRPDGVTFVPQAEIQANLLNENFDYGSAGGTLTTVSGGLWVNHSGTTNFIQYSPSAGLTMPSYVASGIGGAPNFINSGEDINRSFTAQTTGDLYYAALVRISAAQTVGDYFLHFKDTATGFRGRLFAKDNGSGGLLFGLLSSNDGVPSYGATIFSYNTTYLVAVKYNIDVSRNSSLYILDSCASTEPGTPLATSTTTTVYVPISAVAIRQGTAANAPSGTVDGIRVADNWTDAVSCVATAADLEIAKSVDRSEIFISEMVTYTVTLTNTGGMDAFSVHLTDTLPAEVDFGAWIQQPEGTAVTDDVVTWTGDIPASGTVELVFSANHMGFEGDIVTNVAQYEGAGETGTAEVTFTVVDSTPDITFVYHDLEDVVLPGEQVFLAGEFNFWSPTATPMTPDAGYDVFTAVVPNLTSGSTYQYKYVIVSGSVQWNWLQSNNRSYTVSTTATLDEYRDVVVQWANLQWPSTLDAVVGQAAGPVYGRVWVNGLTEDPSAGRSLKAELGYGTAADPAAWTWFPMTFNVLAIPDYYDEYMGSMTPSAPGTFHYATRYDGNWGAGNPNASWSYGDLDGVNPGDPFELDQTGVMTSILYDIGITKACPPSPVDPGATIHYTLSYQVNGEALSGVIVTDTLPADVSYVSDSSGVTPSQPTPGTLIWDLGNVPGSGSFVVTAQVSPTPVQYNLTNNAWIDAENDASSLNNFSSCSNTRSGMISIYDIQYTTDPGPGTYPSPFDTQVITTTGTVCAIAGNYAVVSDAMGPWHSVIVYNGTQTKPPIGTQVLITGELTEYFGLTEFSYPAIVNLGEGDLSVCGYTPVDTAVAPYNNAALSEPYEAVLVQYNLATITNNTLTGRNGFKDAGNPSTGMGRWGDWGYFSRPALNTQFQWIRGLLGYSFNEYRVMPPTAADAKELDVIPPAVVSTDPASGAIDVNLYKPVSAVFSEEMDPATINTSTFLITGPSGDVAGAVSYDASTFTAMFVPSAALPASTAFTARLTTGIEDTTGNALAADYVWTFTTGASDTTPPDITARFPEAGSTGALLTTDVVITFSEELDPDTVLGVNFTLTGPFGAVPWSSVSYDSVLHQVTLNPSGMLLPTTLYTVNVSDAVTDWAGLPVPVAQRFWSFTTQVEPEMFAYHGDIHNHTSYSDGSGTPQQAFTTGRANGLEFLAISDHSYAIDDTEWADTLAQAEAFNDPGDFITLRGFEYTQGGEGHANVYNTIRHAVRTDTTATCTMCDYTPNLETGVTVDGFYHWLSITGTVALDGNGTVLQFNHPGWINFNDWKYHPEVEEIAQLEEVGNGWGSSYVFSWDEFIRSLDYGWKVGATNNTDNHTNDWGSIGPNRTGVVMAGLTRDNLMDALKARRTFATEDSNAELFFKANGYWMGSEMPNSGSMSFHVWGSDPDSEVIDLIQIITYGGQEVASIQPGTSSFDWELTQSISAGSHYYLVLVTQADGDRIVASPVWTSGVEDVSITDLTIQPSLPTTHNPSLLSARITNRGASAHTLTISFTANGTAIGSQTVTVSPCTSGPCSDAYATISWQPTEVGPVTLGAAIQVTPAGDSPDDNTRSLDLTVTDEYIPLVLIDTGHNNIGVDPHGISQFVNDLTLHGYNVLFNLDTITASDLPTDTVKLLILNSYGPNQLADEEIQAIADYVAAGGSLWMNAMSDYTGKVTWAHNLAPRMNALVSAVETAAGSQVPIRFNDDEVLDGNDNNGYPWGILWHNFPVSDTTGVGMNVLQIQSWSDASLMDRNGGALTEEDLGPNGFMMVLGDNDPGNGSYGEANRTHNVDAEGAGYPTNDAYIYQAGTLLPGGAGYDLAENGGRILFYGDSNDPFNVFAYVSGDGKQNELFNLEAVMWLLGEPLQLQTVAEARIDPELDDTPDNLNKLVWVEGKVTAGYGEFFDVLYVQDDTAGITVFAPAGNASGAVDPEFNRGDCVRVVGTIDQYGGDTEIQFFETEQVQVTQIACIPAEEVAVTGSLPLGLSTHDAALEANEGWLVVVTGTVTAKTGVDTVWLDDGSGPVRLFLDGYNGTWEDVSVGDRLKVAGMASEDGFGARIRVRNHLMHPSLPDDVLKLPQIYKQVTPQADVPLGGVVTYTLTISNVASVALLGVQMTDALPEAVDFDSWVLQNGAAVSNDVVTWNGTVAAGESLVVSFRALVSSDPAFYGQTVVNTASFTSANAGSAASQVQFTVETEPLTPILTIAKAVYPETDVPLGGTVAYYVLLQNTGNTTASGVSLEDILPAEVDFGGWLVNPGAVVVDDVITWNGDVPVAVIQFVFTATVGTDPAFYSTTVTNTATYDSANAGSGSASAGFVVEAEPLVPILTVAKAVSPSEDVSLGGVVTYTLTLVNSGTGDATGVALEDILPPEVDFGEWVIQSDAQVSNDVITWGGIVPAGSTVTISFTAVVGSDPAFYGQTITNTASFSSDNAGSGSASASFAVEDEPLPIVFKLYLPIILKNP